MGFRKRWPAAPRNVLCSFKALRRSGPALWPFPSPPCTSFKPLPPELGSLPGQIEKAVRDGVTHALKDAPPTVTRDAPNTSAPFRSRPLNESFWAIVTAFDPVAFFAGLDLYDALQGTAATPVPVFVAFLDTTPTPAAAGANPQPLYQRTPNNNTRFHLSGVEIVPNNLDAYSDLAFTVSVGGRTMQDRVEIDALRDVSVEVSPRNELELSVVNRDPLSVFLLFVTVRGWIYTSEGQGNFLSNAVLKEDGDWIEPQYGCAPERKDYSR